MTFSPVNRHVSLRNVTEVRQRGRSDRKTAIHSQGQFYQIMTENTNVVTSRHSTDCQPQQFSERCSRYDTSVEASVFRILEFSMCYGNEAGLYKNSGGTQSIVMQSLGKSRPAVRPPKTTKIKVFFIFFLKLCQATLIIISDFMVLLVGKNPTLTVCPGKQKWDSLGNFCRTTHVPLV